ncbi:MAG: alkaline phosphatase family protein [Phycisphaeraceae bacterium]|nr:alkaline phosphatase family protein [Phycisphaeraceae bacterium]
MTTLLLALSLFVSASSGPIGELQVAGELQIADARQDAGGRQRVGGRRGVGGAPVASDPTPASPEAASENATPPTAEERARAAARAAAAARPDAFPHVILISIDGVHADVLKSPIIETLPSMARLMRGPHTLEARTDPDFTVTLPNHVAMVTGLHAAEHAWLRNDEPPGPKHGGTIHDRANRYVPSMFDVAHDHGLATSLSTGKTKFWLLQQTYGSARGAKDRTGENNGRAKIDAFLHAESSEDLVEALMARLTRLASQDRRTLDFLHIAEPDTAGHAEEWDLTPGSHYLRTMARVDAWMSRLIAHIESNPALRGSTALVITTDHGGGDPAKTHTNPDAPCNFIIPFLVWLGEDRAPSDLYKLNAQSRVRPSPLENPEIGIGLPPIRNGDAGNLCLALLGLPTIDGSSIGGATPLAVVSEGEAWRVVRPDTTAVATSPSARIAGSPVATAPDGHDEPAD